DAGAEGFLLKTASPAEIIGAVRAVRAGDAILSPRSTRQLLDHYRRSEDRSAREKAAGALAELTERERAVAAAVGHGLSNAEIAARLYGSAATVKAHLAAVQTKLGLRNRVQVADHAERAGLLRAHGPSRARRSPRLRDKNVTSGGGSVRVARVPRALRAGPSDGSPSAAVRWTTTQRRWGGSTRGVRKAHRDGTSPTPSPRRGQLDPRTPPAPAPHPGPGGPGPPAALPHRPRRWPGPRPGRGRQRGRRRRGGRPRRRHGE